MITSVNIKNFQSHKNTTLKFHPGVNAIIGSSDSGKTAIIRAIKWAVWNRPLGDSFRSSWGGDTLVTIDLPEGQIQRLKSNKDNSYLMNGKLEFKAMGQEAPEEIALLLNIDEVNLQQQLDRPFLLDSSPGAVAEHFNRVAHLDSIDRAVSHVQKTIRQLDQEVRREEQTEEELHAALLKFNFLNNMESELEEIEKDDQALRAWRGKQEGLRSIISLYQELKERVKKYDKTLALEKPLTAILCLFEQTKELEVQVKRLEDLVDEIKKISTKKLSAQKILLIEKELNAILVLIGEKEELKKQGVLLTDLCSLLGTSVGQLQSKERTIKALQKSFEQKMPKVCPLCGSEVAK